MGSDGRRRLSSAITADAWSSPLGSNAVNRRHLPAWDGSVPLTRTSQGARAGGVNHGARIRSGLMHPDQPRICVLGSIIVDLVVRAPRLPRPGETVMGDRIQRHPGGKGANQAVAAARMGSVVTLIGTTGDDDDGRLMLHTLQEAGVDVSRVATNPASATGTAVVSVAETGENCIIVSTSANMSLTPERVLDARNSIASADVLAMQLEVPMDAAIAAAAIARDSGTTVLLNAAPVPDAGVPAELLAMTDALIVNERELASLAPGHADIDAAMLALATRGPRVVVATLGERGVRYTFERGAAAGVEAFPIDAVDTVGAGDAFVGTFATRWAEHQVGGALDAISVMDATCWGAAAGALAAMRHGAIPSLPMRAEVVSLLRRGAPSAG